MLRKILIALAVVVVGFVLVVALQPSQYLVSRTALVAAPPDTVFAQINDFHKWEAWSPWAKLDPAAKNTFEGPEAGTGAVFSWAGNKQVGEGRMTITESRPNDLIRIKLEFIKPFPSTATTEFSFQPQSGQTQVTWAMSGEKKFVSKAFCLFVNMDKMIGSDFERGFANLKSVTEATVKK